MKEGRESRKGRESPGLSKFLLLLLSSVAAVSCLQWELD